MNFDNQDLLSYKFLQDIENNGITIPLMDEPILHIRGFDNVSNRSLGIISLLVHLGTKIVQSLFHVMSGKLT